MYILKALSPHTNYYDVSLSRSNSRIMKIYLPLSKVTTVSASDNRNILFKKYNNFTNKINFKRV